MASKFYDKHLPDYCDLDNKTRNCPGFRLGVCENDGGIKIDMGPITDDVDGKTFYLTHGHHLSPQALPPLPQGSIFLSGHTHVKLDENVGGIRCLNPGSVSIPKDGSHSCLIYEDGSFFFRVMEE